jgi:hypothetical protein
MNLTDAPLTMGEVMKASREQLEHWRARGPAKTSKAEKRVYDRIAARLAKIRKSARAQSRPTEGMK